MLGKVRQILDAHRKVVVPEINLRQNSTDMKPLLLLFSLLPLAALAQTTDWSPCDSLSTAWFAKSSPDSAFFLTCEWRQEAEPILYRLTLKSRLHQKTLVVSETSVYDDGSPFVRFSDDSRFLLIDSDSAFSRRLTKIIDLHKFQEIQSVPGYLCGFDSPNQVAFVYRYIGEGYGRPTYGLFRHDLVQNQTALVIQMNMTWDDFETPRIQPDPARRILSLQFPTYCTSATSGLEKYETWEYLLGY